MSNNTLMNACNGGSYTSGSGNVPATSGNCGGGGLYLYVGGNCVMNVEWPDTHDCVCTCDLSILYFSCLTFSFARLLRLIWLAMLSRISSMVVMETHRRGIRQGLNVI